MIIALEFVLVNYFCSLEFAFAFVQQAMFMLLLSLLSLWQEPWGADQQCREIRDFLTSQVIPATVRAAALAPTTTPLPHIKDKK